jgi:hypothetical protein
MYIISNFTHLWTFIMKLTSAIFTVENSDDRQRRCPKHVGFYNENKFGIISVSGWLFKKKRVAKLQKTNLLSCFLKTTFIV